MSSTESLQTLLIGIDAGCFNVVNPFFEDGVLPTLESVFQEGASDTLHSQIPPWTASAWPTVYTGVNPGKHGVFGFLRFDGYDDELVTADTVRELTLWEILDHHGLRSVVVNVPVTHPPHEIDGAVIPGYVGPDSPTCHPPDIRDEVEAITGEYYVYPRVDEDDTEADILSEMVELTRKRGRAFRFLCDEFAPDFGFVQFQQTDTVFHEFGGDLKRARAVYEEVDRQLSLILDRYDPDTVIVASDHGINACRQRFHENDLLRDHGYIETKTGGEGMPTWVKIKENGSSQGDRLSTWLMESIAKAGFTSQRVGTLLERVELLDLMMDIVPDDFIRAASEQVDFANSRAYMRSRVETGIRLNVEGREPDGVVPKSEYEQVREELITLLSQARTPEGDPVFEEVVPREEYFQGPYAGEAVDIVTVPTNFKYKISTWLIGDQFKKFDEPEWDHTLKGFVAISGGKGQEGTSLEGAELVDIAPTVLASLDVSVSDRMDGSPLPAVSESGELGYPKPDVRRSATDLEGVENRLRNIGYLE